MTQYRASNVDAIALALQNKNEEAYKLFEAKSAPLGDQVFDKLIAISNESNQSAEQMTQTVKDDVTSSKPSVSTRKTTAKKPNPREESWDTHL